jgi:hypothetical protein
MFSRLWKAFDGLFDAFDADMKEMEDDNNRRMENLKKRLDEKLPDGTESETIREEETKPDGTRITRVITKTRTVSVVRKKS